MAIATSTIDVHSRGDCDVIDVTDQLASMLGTWQQLIFVDFDNRPRTRSLVVQLVGE
jgi:thiamine phosphate synthase YjbQ (UPF0047 family)